MIGGGIHGPPPRNAHPATHRSARALSQRDFGHALSSFISSRGLSFTLTATGDSAFGDVVMIPRGLGRPLQAWNNAAAPADAAPPRPAVLSINFVRVAHVIEGTYATRAGRGVDSQTGEWKVTRRKP